MTETYGSVWEALFDNPEDVKLMEEWSRDKMTRERLLKECSDYMEAVYHNVDTADANGIIESTLEMIYGKGIWDILNKLSDDKSRGIPFLPPDQLMDDEGKKVYLINPEGTPPPKSCKWCKDDDTDWRGIDTSYLLVRCGFCRDGGQDW